MIDSHAHLSAAEFDADRADVISRALAAGVQQIVVVGEDLGDNERVLAVCAGAPGVLKPCVGLHPDRFADDREPPPAGAIDSVESLARRQRSRIVAIGEVGLDYWVAREETNRRAQRYCLERMTGLALELGLPLNVHSRSAGRYTLDLLAACGGRRVLMHAFDGKAGHAEQAAEKLGFMFSVPPSVVRSAQKQKLVRRLPLESLLLESDSPVLGPERGERNEPANLRYAVQCIAELKAVSADRVCEQTTLNARRLFGI